METVTLTPEMYNSVKFYADREHVSVDEYVVMLIKNDMQRQERHTSRYKMKSVGELSPILQEILSFPKIGSLDSDDVNGSKARAEACKEKYGI